MQLKLPEFSPTNAEMWFYAIECHFTGSNVRSELSKYRKTVTCLGIETLAKLRSFFEAQPDLQPEPYKRLKSAVIAYYKASTSAQITQLLQGFSLDGQKPSELLNKMRHCAGSNVTDTYLEPLWLSRLPDYASAVVSALPIPLVQKGEAADNILDKIGFKTNAPTQQYHHAAPVAVSSEDKMLRVLESLEKRLAALEVSNTRSRSPNRSQSSGRGRSSNRSRSRSAHVPEGAHTCWYHETFGDKATNCRPGCHLAPKN